jgi:hypothetical protein
MKNAVFWDAAPCRSCVNRRFGDCILQPPAHAGSLPADFYTMKMEAIRSSETSFYTRYTRRHIPEDAILRNVIHIQREWHSLPLYVLFVFTNYKLHRLVCNCLL